MSTLEDWRKRIDEIDQQLVNLLNERSRCAVEIGHLKKKVSQAAWQPQREAEILRNVVKSNHGPLDDAAIRRLFERIIDEARSLERHAMDQEEPASSNEWQDQDEGKGLRAKPKKGPCGGPLS
jgi:chorismate mutase-like protein